MDLNQDGIPYIREKTKSEIENGYIPSEELKGKLKSNNSLMVIPKNLMRAYFQKPFQLFTKIKEYVKNKKNEKKNLQNQKNDNIYIKNKSNMNLDVENFNINRQKENKNMQYKKANIEKEKSFRENLKVSEESIKVQENSLEKSRAEENNMKNNQIEKEEDNERNI